MARKKKQRLSDANFLVLLIATVLIIVGGLFIYSLGRPRSPQGPDPNQKEIVELRYKAKEEINKLFDQVEVQTHLNKYDSAFYDSCFVDFEYSGILPNHSSQKCAISITHFYSFNGNLDAGNINLEKTLKAYAKEPFSISGESDRAYLTNNLWFYVDYFDTNTGSPDINRLEGTQNPLYHKNALNYYEQHDFKDMSELYKRIATENKYLVALAFSNEYFPKQLQ